MVDLHQHCNAADVVKPYSTVHPCRVCIVHVTVSESSEKTACACYTTENASESCFLSYIKHTARRKILSRKQKTNADERHKYICPLVYMGIRNHKPQTDKRERVNRPIKLTQNQLQLLYLYSYCTVHCTYLYTSWQGSPRRMI
jgi:hypothetical protein